MPKEADTRWYLDASIDDLNLYFSHTFLQLRVKGTNNPFQYAFVEGFGGLGGSVIQVKLRGKPRSEMFNLQGVEFNFQFPEVGAYNFQKTVVLFSRKTARQNKKALCGNSCFVTPVHERMRGMGRVPELFQMKNAFSFTLGHVCSAFENPKFSQVEEAFDQISSGEYFARALSNDFYLTCGVCSENPDLWLHETLVGTMHRPDQIEVIEPLLMQETKDFFRKGNIQINGN